MARVVYFDRNVFHHLRDRHLPEHGITEADFQSLLDAIKASKLAIARSVTLFEEILPVLETTPDVAAVEKQLILGLTDASKFIRPWDELIEYDIAFYAHGWPLPSRFTSEFKEPERYLTPEPEERPDLLKVVQKTKDSKLKVQAGLTDLRAKHRAIGFVGKKKPDFEVIYRACAVETAENLAERFGVSNECRVRGIEGLLDIRSVKVYVGAELSLEYALAYEDCRVDKGYWHDLQHTVLASATDTFVTQDRRWQRILDRIPVNDFEVIDLKTLVQQLQ